MSTPIHGHATPFEFLIPSIDNDFQVLAFEGTEAVSSLYAIRIELVSSRQNVPLETLIRQRALLRFGAEGQVIHGHIEDVVAGKIGRRLTHYHVSLVPALHYLQFSYNHRIFQDMTVPDIVTQVLKEHGILSHVASFVVRESTKREYCTQYDESDFEFIQRLCSEEGISWHHSHDPQDHYLLFVDHQNLFPRTSPAFFHQDSGMEASTPVVSRFSMRFNTRTERAIRRDYDFRYPKATRESLSIAESGHGPQHPNHKTPINKYLRDGLEDYRYSFLNPDDKHAKRLARNTLERYRVDYQVAEGCSDQPSLRGGHFFELKEHPRKQYNEEWLLLSVTHWGRQPQVLEEALAPEDDLAGEIAQGYRNTFKAIHWHMSYRPPLAPRRSVMVTQTAIVIGPDGQDVHCDEHGRVKVRFHWDRREASERNNSCWLRVSSSWAGADFGAMTIPRVGMEVVVTYLEGNPDNPLITGCVPNSNARVPYSLPQNKTRSVFRSRSTPALQPSQNGYNELSIEDLGGQELIYLRAQRDLQQVIGNDSRLEVGNQRHELIKGNSVTVLQAEEQRTVCADRKVSLKANDFLQVAGQSHTLVAQSMVIEAGQHIHLKAGAHLTLDAGSSLTLKAGGQHIVIGSSGIFGSMLMLPDPHASTGPGAAVLPPGMLEGLPLLPGSLSYRQHAAAGALLPGACCQPGVTGHCPVHQGGPRT